MNLNEVTWTTEQVNDYTQHVATINERQVVVVENVCDDSERSIIYYVYLDENEIARLDTLAEAKLIAYQAAMQRIVLRIITKNRPTVSYGEVNGWGPNANKTIVEGDVGEIQIEVGPQERYSLRVYDNRLILTTYNRPLYFMLPSNMQLTTDQYYFERMKGSVQDQNEMIQRLLASGHTRQFIFSEIDALLQQGKDFSQAVQELYQQIFDPPKQQQ
jgi:hypothetical protein